MIPLPTSTILPLAFAVPSWDTWPPPDGICAVASAALILTQVNRLSRAGERAEFEVASSATVGPARHRQLRANRCARQVRLSGRRRGVHTRLGINLAVGPASNGSLFTVGDKLYSIRTAATSVHRSGRPAHMCKPRWSSTSAISGTIRPPSPFSTGRTPDPVMNVSAVSLGSTPVRKLRRVLTAERGRQ